MRWSRCHQGLSTDEVLQKFTKTLTANDKCSYCHKLQKENHWAYRAKANAFISHAFTYKFLDAVAALEDHFKDERDEAVIRLDRHIIESVGTRYIRFLHLF